MAFAFGQMPIPLSMLDIAKTTGFARSGAKRCCVHGQWPDVNKLRQGGLREYKAGGTEYVSDSSGLLYRVTRCSDRHRVLWVARGASARPEAIGCDWVLAGGNLQPKGRGEREPRVYDRDTGAGIAKTEAISRPGSGCVALLLNDDELPGEEQRYGRKRRVAGRGGRRHAAARL